MATDHNEFFARPQAEARIYDLEQFTLWTNTPNRQGFRARLAFGERNGAPRLSIFTNWEENQGPKVIYAGFDPTVFEMFLQDLESVADAPNGAMIPQDLMDRAPGADRSQPRSSAPTDLVVRCKWYVGKNAEGVIWIGAEQAGSKIAFELLPSNWHHFYKLDGSPLPKPEASVRYAKGLVNLLRRVYGQFAARVRPYVEPKKNGGFSKETIAPAAGSATSFSTFDDTISF